MVWRPFRTSRPFVAAGSARADDGVSTVKRSVSTCAALPAPSRQPPTVTSTSPETNEPVNA